MDELQLDTITNADCRKWLAELPDGVADLIYWDPPYNLQTGKGKLRRWEQDTVVRGVPDEWDQIGSHEEYDAFIDPIMVELLRVMKEDGSFWVSGTYHCIHRIGRLLQDHGCWMFSDIQWMKNNALPNMLGVRPQVTCETLIWVTKSKEGCKEVQRKYKQYGDKKMKAWAEKTFGIKVAASVWSLPVCGGKERIKDGSDNLHPTQKPVALLQRMMEVCTKQGDVVLDPMAGVCTTAEAATILRRRYLLCELEKKYVDAGRERLRRLSPLKVVAPE